MILTAMMMMVMTVMVTIGFVTTATATATAASMMMVTSMMMVMLRFDEQHHVVLLIGSSLGHDRISISVQLLLLRFEANLFQIGTLLLSIAFNDYKNRRE